MVGVMHLTVKIVGIFTLNPADVMGLTGVSSTSTVGSVTAKSDFTGTLTGVSIKFWCWFNNTC